ncbi:MAG: pyridoxal-phosphate dependent enzyme [Nocardiopsaceae bacterium]|nr:pyridoxal-phosphate dependent enzyme [Nocardiopsaceae bacterium]
MLTPVATPHTYVPRIPQILGFPSQCHVYVKEECYQCGRSVKGRVAYAMACQSILSGRPIVESSSGNLALGLAFWCKRLGAPRPLCLVDDCCEASMREALADAGCLLESVPLTGAEIEQQAGVHRRIALAEEYARQGYYWPNQYDGTEWLRVHAETTGPEVWNDPVSFDLIAGAVGTGATMSGIAASRPADRITRIVAVEPAGSTIFNSVAGAYRVAGAGNPFTPGNYRAVLIDDEITVEDKATFQAMKALRGWGYRIGSSGSMALVGALRAATRAPSRGIRSVLVLVADDGWYETDW